MPNIFQPDEWVERAEAPLIGRTARVGAQAGAERLGATLYEIDPGNNGSPFQLHHGSAPPGTADRLALAFPREAQVDRLAGELRPT